MKHLITLTACLMILMALLSQFVQNQHLLLQLEQGTQVVDVYCKTKDRKQLKSCLSQIMDCKAEEIEIKQTGDKITISCPVNGILANPGFWGLDEQENRGRYCWKRMVEDE